MLLLGVFAVVLLYVVVSGLVVSFYGLRGGEAFGIWVGVAVVFVLAVLGIAAVVV